ncbi:MAG: lysophospholipid acyltransferase family protein [Pyrinomonadaceae bacterium]
MAKKSDLQVKVEYYAAWLIFSSLRILPRRLAIFIGVLLGDLAYLLLGRLRQIGMTNTEIAFPEMSEAMRRKIVRGSFRSLGRQLGEISQFPKASEGSLGGMVEFPVTDEDWLRYNEMKEQGRGIIFLTPHFGGWEVLAFASSALIGPQSYLVRRLDNPRLEKMVEEVRGKFGNQPIGKKNSALPALRLLREGGNLGVLPDINSQRHEGVFVPFFGKPACTTAGVAALAMRTDAVAIVIGAAWDERKKKYVVHFGEVLEFESTGEREQDVKNFTARFTAEIEKLIRKSPEQWMWIHRRWKTRPKGEPDVY